MLLNLGILHHDVTGLRLVKHGARLIWRERVDRRTASRGQGNGESLGGWFEYDGRNRIKVDFCRIHVKTPGSAWSKWQLHRAREGVNRCPKRGDYRVAAVLSHSAYRTVPS